MWRQYMTITAQPSHFYSHIPCGMWRYFFQSSTVDWCNFYSHIPCGMWRFSSSHRQQQQRFLLTHPVWDVTQKEKLENGLLKFLLTHPVWDVTAFTLSWYICCWYFYSHIPCGMWRIIHRISETFYNFYSHIPCGMWRSRFGKHSRSISFLLTHPVWDVTNRYSFKPSYLKISTHTSRVGCDLTIFSIDPFWNNFYSHIPCGMWLMVVWFLLDWYAFLLTHPVWDVTSWTVFSLTSSFISTHTSRVGCDSVTKCSIKAYFISTHTSRVGCDSYI